MRDSEYAVSFKKSNMDDKDNKRPMVLDTLLENQLGHWPKFQKLHIYSLSTPGRWTWDYFHSKGSRFWDIGYFSKLPYLAIKLGHWQKFRKLHIYSLLPQGVEIKLIFTLRAAVSEIWADFQNCHIWAWNLVIGRSSWSCTKLSFYPRGSKLSLFLLYGQPFPRYRPIFKMAIFGHETWQVAKVPEVAHT